MNLYGYHITILKIVILYPSVRYMPCPNFIDIL